MGSNAGKKKAADGQMGNHDLRQLVHIIAHCNGGNVEKKQEAAAAALGRIKGGEKLVVEDAIIIVNHCQDVHEEIFVAAEKTLQAAGLSVAYILELTRHKAEAAKVKKKAAA